MPLESDLIVIDGLGKRVADTTLGIVAFATGMLTAGSFQNGGTLSNVGSVFQIKLNKAVAGLGGVIFNGTFSSPVSWVPVPGQKGFYTLEGSLAGTWMINGKRGPKVTGLFTSQVYSVTITGQNTKFEAFEGTFGSGDTFLTPSPVPEPGTLGLLGTGMVGLPLGLYRKLS